MAVWPQIIPTSTYEIVFHKLSLSNIPLFFLKKSRHQMLIQFYVQDHLPICLDWAKVIQFCRLFMVHLPSFSYSVLTSHRSKCIQSVTWTTKIESTTNRYRNFTKINFRNVTCHAKVWIKSVDASMTYKMWGLYMRWKYHYGTDILWYLKKFLIENIPLKIRLSISRLSTNFEGSD